ncbi:MAG TPA: AAA family ATPase, partial [Acidimicrobiia bacterium]
MALERAWREAAHGRGSVALVTGEPGIGKSALIRSFVEGEASHGRVLLGDCDDLSIPSPLGPFRHLFGSQLLSGDL